MSEEKFLRDTNVVTLYAEIKTLIEGVKSYLEASGIELE